MTFFLPSIVFLRISAETTTVYRYIIQNQYNVYLMLNMLRMSWMRWRLRSSSGMMKAPLMSSFFFSCSSIIFTSIES